MQHALVAAQLHLRIAGVHETHPGAEAAGIREHEGAVDPFQPRVLARHPLIADHERTTGDAADFHRHVFAGKHPGMAQPGQRNAQFGAGRFNQLVGARERAPHGDQVRGNVVVPFNLEHRLRLIQPANPHHAQRSVAHRVEQVFLAVRSLGRQSLPLGADPLDDRLVRPDGMRTRHIGQPRRQIDGVAVGVFTQVHHDAGRNAHLQGHAQGFWPALDALGVAALHENGRADGSHAVIELRQHAVAQELDHPARVRLAHAPYPGRDFRDDRSYLGTIHCLIGCSAPGEIDKENRLGIGHRKALMRNTLQLQGPSGTSQRQELL